ncbi:hypothetical protein G7Y89_g7664 [Cudoniella acicularis]|uniref:Uncharacterized protein n=1 Tax=Cudoniella acicularis TaxID=354080 RepID=A0A8H4RIV9_9HELO|nr:hypothetical protein G7Y89_g7664 [Cudoniella acicularis]
MHFSTTSTMNVAITLIALSSTALGQALTQNWNPNGDGVLASELLEPAASYFGGTTILQNSAVPFYPPPDSASAGACCSDLSVIDFSSYIKTVQGEISSSSDKCAILNNGTETCISEWKVPYAGTSAYNPLSLPSGEPGTAPLTNQAGNAFTTMASSTTTLSLSGYTSTITFASFNAKAAGADLNSIAASSAVVVANPTATGSGGVVATGTQTGTATGTGTAASTTATKASSGTKMDGSLTFLSIAATFVIFRILI